MKPKQGRMSLESLCRICAREKVELDGLRVDPTKHVPWPVAHTESPQLEITRPVV